MLVNVFNYIIGFMFVAAGFVMAVCSIFALFETQSKRKRSKYWDEEHKKGQAYKAAAQELFKTAADEATATVEEFQPWENCDDDCYMCGYKQFCEKSLADPNKRG